MPVYQELGISLTCPSKSSIVPVRPAPYDRGIATQLPSPPCRTWSAILQTHCVSDNYHLPSGHPFNALAGSAYLLLAALNYSLSLPFGLPIPWRTTPLKTIMNFDMRGRQPFPMTVLIGAFFVNCDPFILSELAQVLNALSHPFFSKTAWISPFTSCHSHTSEYSKPADTRPSNTNLCSFK